MADPLPHQRVKVNIPAGGSMTEGPPPGAPHEVAMPLQPHEVQRQVRAARSAEADVDALIDSGHFRDRAMAVADRQRQLRENPDGVVVIPPQRQGGSLFRPPTPLKQAAQQVVASRRQPRPQPSVEVAGAVADASTIVLTDTGPVEPAPSIIDEMNRVTLEVWAAGQREVLEGALAAATPVAAAAAEPPPEPDLLTPDELQLLRQTHPAASNTDTPAAGLPTAIADPGKKITGGFGVAGGMDQYYPLRGDEIRVLAEALCEKLINRMRNDLRLSVGLTYPRAEVRLLLTVQGYPIDNHFEIPVVEKPALPRTSVELARQLADECVFVVQEEMVEVVADGSSGTPPNAVRMQLGLEVPRRHQVKMGRDSKMTVDRS